MADLERRASAPAVLCVRRSPPSPAVLPPRWIDGKETPPEAPALRGRFPAGADCALRCILWGPPPPAESAKRTEPVRRQRQRLPPTRSADTRPCCTAQVCEIVCAVLGRESARCAHRDSRAVTLAQTRAQLPAVAGGSPPPAPCLCITEPLPSGGTTSHPQRMVPFFFPGPVTLRGHLDHGPGLLGKGSAAHSACSPQHGQWRALSSSCSWVQRVLLLHTVRICAPATVPPEVAVTSASSLGH